MDDLMKKMQEVLSDEQSMQQLNELAAMFRSEMNGAPEHTPGDSPPPAEDGQPALTLASCCNCRVCSAVSRRTKTPPCCWRCAPM